MKRIAIIQSCYVPWRGFFDLISQCDEYVIYDQADFRKRHWHNRNRVKSANGPLWLTIPVITHNRFAQPIEEVEIAELWTTRHWETIYHVYNRAPFFKSEAPALKTLFDAVASEKRLTEVNEILLRALASRLGITTTISRDKIYPVEGRRSQRLLATCLAAGATHYLSGPSAKEYLDETIFHAAGIKVEWMDYGSYPEYPQLNGAFVDGFSVLDLLFNTGPEATNFIRPRA